MSNEIGSIRYLTSQNVRDVIRDVQLQQRGVTFHYCTDPHEIYDFCFPVKPEQLRRTDISTLADDQIALYEIFFEATQSPILLPSYNDEMARLTAYLQGVVDRTYAQRALFDYVETPLALLKNVGRTDATGDVMPVIEDSMNAVMVIALGLLSMGVTRFDDIARRRLTDPENVNDDIRSIAQTYVQTELVDEICDAVHKARTSLRNFEADAEAIDMLVVLNAGFEERFLNSVERPRHVFIYFSSAARSRFIFGLPVVRDVLPMIDGDRFSFLRTRAQVFLSVICRRYREDGTLDFDETINQLNSIYAVVRELESIKPTEKCGTCLIDGGSGGDCSHRDRCGGLREVAARVRERRSVLNNLALARIVDRYAALKRVSEAGGNERRAIYGAFLSRVMKADAQTLALQRIKDVYRIVRHKCHFAVRVARGFAEAKRFAFLRSGRDAVSAASQYLPILPTVHGRIYEELTDEIIHFYRHPVQTAAADLGAIEVISEEYLRLDGSLKEFDATHELVRCLLYMALPVHDGDEAGFQHAIDMIGRFSDRPAEFMYVAAWAGRRSRKFSATDKWIRKAVEMFPGDPRFWHGDALNIYSWLVDSEMGETCPYRTADAIGATLRAIELLEQRQDQRRLNSRWRDTLAANYNNLAFFCTYQVDNEGYSVSRGRRAIDTLKNLVPKIDWEPMFPEYYHTEALVELHEALMLRAEGAPGGEVRAKLQAAYREIANALRMVPEKDTYQHLRETISGELRATA